MRRNRLLYQALLLALAAFLLLPGAALAITLDGIFDDWTGQPCIPDPLGDSPTNNTDLTSVCWATQPGVSIIYFMFERDSANGPVYFTLLVDANNNGGYHDDVDRWVFAFYSPTSRDSEVSVQVRTPGGTVLNSYGGDWGESRAEGGRRAEAMVSFADLGIDVGQTISMIAGAAQNNNLPNIDTAPDSGSITWSPIPVLGWPLLGLMVAGFIAWTWYRRGRYVWARPS
ncbi:MAG: hypothetical protein ACP5TV_06880 [Anaerolineae bacterium]